MVIYDFSYVQYECEEPNVPQFCATFIQFFVIISDATIFKISIIFDLYNNRCDCITISKWRLMLFSISHFPLRMLYVCMLVGLCLKVCGQMIMCVRAIVSAKCEMRSLTDDSNMAKTTSMEATNDLFFAFSSHSRVRIAHTEWIVKKFRLKRKRSQAKKSIEFGYSIYLKCWNVCSMFVVFQCAYLFVQMAHMRINQSGNQKHSSIHISIDGAHERTSKCIFHLVCAHSSALSLLIVIFRRNFFFLLPTFLLRFYSFFFLHFISFIPFSVSYSPQ